MNDVESPHGMSTICDLRDSNPHPAGTGDTLEELLFVSLGGPWPGHRGPSGIRVIAARGYDETLFDHPYQPESVNCGRWFCDLRPQTEVCARRLYQPREAITVQTVADGFESR
ncbi:MAG: hypothetical protein A07HR60_00676 [uncultured archaeon A07HR60]|nr:MAG: hypothetical protein A07HR60_00676 [uncultured archaeon A07HR60]